MTEVVSVKFKNRGKTYYFAAAGNTVGIGQDVIVETSKGLEFAQCVMGNHFVPDEKVIPPIRPVVRVATENDLRVAEINKKREREAFDICKKKIEDHGLDMKLVDVECSFEGNKITFFFTSDGRVDFRELVKDLASVFRNRIELRQIGVRDEAKMLGGIGICGRPFCCSQFLDEFQPVSTKMAKIQSMSLNPSKISGTCGRLMCCLRYEEEAYENLVKTVPKNGAFVETPAGYGNVTQVNLLRRTVKVKLDGEGEDVFKTYSADEVAAIPGGRPKPGEPLPQLLKNRPAPERSAPRAHNTGAPVYPVEPPTTSTFLFRAFLGSGGRLLIINRSVLVKMMLSANLGDMNGSMSLALPHRAEPYSMPCLYFFAFLLRKYTASRSPAPQEKPISKSSGCRLGRGFANATGKVPIIAMILSPNSFPSASRHTSPRFVATSPSKI